MKRISTFVIGLIAVALSTAAVAGVEPSPFIHFQGVLRGADDTPLDGSFDMTFRFFSAAAGGSEILVDRHLAAGTGAVAVTGGMFGAVLGKGAVSDGSGPGTFTNLAAVFRDHAEVYLEIQIGTEVLSPRSRIHSAAYALNSSHLGGKAPAEYLDTSSTSQTKYGRLTVDTSALVAATGLVARADAVAGQFENTDGVATVYVAKNTAEGAIAIDARATLGSKFEGLSDYGIEGFGPTAGGHFEDSNASGRAYVGNDDLGIAADGNDAGAYLHDRDQSGYAYVGYGDRGIQASGDEAGGRFGDHNSSGYVWCGYGDLGLSASGSAAGGYFQDPDSSSEAYVAYGIYGLYAAGSLMGASFQDTNSSGYAYCAHGDYGIRGYGNSTGGYFADRDDTGLAYVGYGDRGIWGKGAFAGGTFSHPDNVTYWADVSTSTRKIVGTGTVSFVQNHPYERDKVIVYAAPEGDEVAVYTRGSARLEGGFARVALGPTFPFVANPDLGLTAHVTARGDVERLWVESVTTRELLVRGSAGSDAAFDFIVYGLRIGFEDVAIVQPKAREAFLPGAAAIASEYGGRDELRSLNASARFQAMGGGAAIDLAQSEALRRAIDGERESVIHSARAAAAAERTETPGPDRAVTIERGSPASTPIDSTGTIEAGLGLTAPSPSVAREIDVPAVPLPVSEAVEPGDVLVSDAEGAGALRRGTIGSDPRVVGVAVGTAEDGSALVATYGVVLCKVDAGYGRIAPGDLLAVSPTPAHAMRAIGAEPGTILGKALEPLESGGGLIRVLVMPR